MNLKFSLEFYGNDINIQVNSYMKIYAEQKMVKSIEKYVF